MAVTPSPYCDTTDLMVGASVFLPDNFDLGKEVKRAADDMDALLGFVYALPLDGLEQHEILLLKSINTKLASGRILLQLYGDGEGTALHAYGLRLVNDAEKTLMTLANGEVYLSAARAGGGSTLEESRGPVIANSDEESGVDIFENAIMRGEPSYWIPGRVTPES